MTLRLTRGCLPVIARIVADEVAFSPRSPGELERVGPLAQPRLGEAAAGRVVEEDAVLLAGPDGVGLAAWRGPCTWKNRPHGRPRARMTDWCSGVWAGSRWSWAHRVVRTWCAQVVEGGQADNGVHAGSVTSGRGEATEGQVAPAPLSAGVCGRLALGRSRAGRRLHHAVRAAAALRTGRCRPPWPGSGCAPCRRHRNASAPGAGRAPARSAAGRATRCRTAGSRRPGNARAV